MLTIVTDSDTRSRLDARMLEAVESQSRIRVDWLRATRTIAVPVESGNHFTREQAELIGEALKESGHSSLFAVAAEDLAQNPPHYWKLNSTADDLAAFSSEFSLFNFALLVLDEPIVILCTTDDFFVLAGPTRFVTKACGSSIDGARGRFRKWAFEERLVRVSERYEEAERSLG